MQDDGGGALSAITASSWELVVRGRCQSALTFQRVLTVATRPSIVTTGSWPSGMASLNLPGPPRRAASSGPAMRSSSKATPAARSATRMGNPLAARLK